MSWFYKTPEGAQQGPYPAGDMRAWFEGGYLPPDLPISQNPQQGYFPLRDWFPNIDRAFLPNAAGNPGRNQPAAKKQAAAPATQRQPQPQPQPVQQVIDPNELRWFFLDTTGNVQGPFSNIQMSDWFKEGFFEPNLQIYDASKDVAQFGWKMLKEYFPNKKAAFTEGMEAQQVGGFNGAPMEEEVPERFRFPAWLPAPPPYRGVPKVYPSEKQPGGGY